MAIVNVFVKNIIFPPLSLLLDGISFGDKKLILRDASAQASQVSVDYGLLIETILDFLLLDLLFL